MKLDKQLQAWGQAIAKFDELALQETNPAKQRRLLNAHSSLISKYLKRQYKLQELESRPKPVLQAPKPKERKMYDYFNDKFRSHLSGCSTMEAAFKLASDDVWRECGFIPYSTFRSFNNVRKRKSKSNNVALQQHHDTLHL